MATELAKCLKLVASANMGAEQQTVWLAAAVDALENIRAAEIAAISAELRRTVTRPAQIVPEIAKLVAERRRQPQGTTASVEADRLELAKRAVEQGNEICRRIGRNDVHWVLRDGQCVIEWRE